MLGDLGSYTAVILDKNQAQVPESWTCETKYSGMLPPERPSWLSWTHFLSCCLFLLDLDRDGHGSKSHTPSEHPNPH